MKKRIKKSKLLLVIVITTLPLFVIGLTALLVDTSGKRKKSNKTILIKEDKIMIDSIRLIELIDSLIEVRINKLGNENIKKPE